MMYQLEGASLSLSNRRKEERKRKDRHDKHDNSVHLIIRKVQVGGGGFLQLYVIYRSRNLWIFQLLYHVWG